MAEEFNLIVPVVRLGFAAVQRNQIVAQKTTGVTCPVCCGTESSVIDSRGSQSGWTRRRRKCACGKRFTTLEMLLPDEAEGTSKLAAGINLITYAMALIKEHEAQYFGYHMTSYMNKSKKQKDKLNGSSN